MLVDTHAHLCLPEFRADLPAVLERARMAGVERIVTVGTDMVTCQQSVALSEQFGEVYAAVGLHPNDEHGQVTVQQLPITHRVVAIGETGLDYYRAVDRSEVQKRLFCEHLALAKDLNLPVIIHQRCAEADLLKIVRAFRPTGVMHCFSGSEQLARACVELGLYISFAGVLTFKNAVALHAIARAVPLEQVLLETDCPYLAPVPHRGTRNEPAYLVHTARALAQIKAVSETDVARITTANAMRLFGFS